MIANDQQSRTSPKECPNCQLLNPPEAQRCDCGYNFQKQSIAEKGERPGKRSGKLVGTTCWLAILQAIQMLFLYMGSAWSIAWGGSDMGFVYLNFGFVDAALLLVAALGVWMRRWQFALVLVIYQTLNVLRLTVGAVMALDPNRYTGDPVFWFIATLIAAASLASFSFTYVSLRPSRKKTSETGRDAALNGWGRRKE
jgi:hypothetical protein